MKKFLNKTVWWFLSSFFAIMLVILFVGNSFLKEYETQINYALHIDPYKTITSENTDTEYFKSPFKKEDGKYDDIAMRIILCKYLKKLIVRLVFFYGIKIIVYH